MSLNESSHLAVEVKPIKDVRRGETMSGVEAVTIETQVETLVRLTTSNTSPADRWDHVLARLGYRRNEHRVEPGIYALGTPGPDSPVFVTSNYTLSFDALRSSLAGIDGYILVLDTQGINVWCAAGKGTFGTDELVNRIDVTGLRQVVRHRVLIVPQLGAPGIAAHEVKKRSGFKVEYGPVRASDLPGYLRNRKATPEMRQVGFGLADRIVLIPVEAVAALPVLIVATILAFVFGGLLVAGAAASAILAGISLFAVVLPWLPTRDFSTKGFILGFAVALPFAMAALLSGQSAWGWARVLQAASLLLALPPITAFLALNFTGSTTFTSRSGVKREIFRYIPFMAATFSLGILVTIATASVKIWGGA